MNGITLITSIEWYVIGITDNHNHATWDIDDDDDYDDDNDDDDKRIFI